MRETLPGHSEEVTVVKAFSDIFVSGDKLGHIRIWRLQNDKVWDLDDTLVKLH